MILDAALWERAAGELQQRLHGARAVAVGRAADGRLGLGFEQKVGATTLLVDLFASTPVVLLVRDALQLFDEPGFVRSLRGRILDKRIVSISSVSGERLLTLRFSARSRFGVADECSLLLELIPRFGNAILLGDERIIAALREFSLAENPARAIEAGRAYTPPPPRPVRATTPSSPIAVQSDSVLELLAHVAGVQAQAAPGALDRDRAALVKKMRDRERAIRSELAALDGKLETISRADERRADGEAIYASLHERLAEERDEAKALAQSHFLAYRKLLATKTSVDRRRAIIEEQLAETLELLWESERADANGVRELRSYLTPTRSAKLPTAKAPRKRTGLWYRTPSGTRIGYGRSPLENAELTFHLARPDDLWFHARGAPGAHVIAQRDDRQEIDDEDTRIAAQLAALHSKAKMSPRASVDFTRRKFVRKRPSAAPGLVFYTEAKTLLVTPQLDASLEVLGGSRA